MEHTRIPWRIVTENPIIQQEGSVNRSERGVAWRGGGGHRFARFSAFPWHRLRSNPTRNENPTSRKNGRYPRGYHRYVEWIETTPPPFRRNALLVSQNSSFVRSSSDDREREREGFGRSWKRIYDDKGKTRYLSRANFRRIASGRILKNRTKSREN